MKGTTFDTRWLAKTSTSVKLLCSMLLPFCLECIDLYRFTFLHQCRFLQDTKRKFGFLIYFIKNWGHAFEIVLSSLIQGQTFELILKIFFGRFVHLSCFENIFRLSFNMMPYMHIHVHIVQSPYLLVIHT